MAVHGRNFSNLKEEACESCENSAFKFEILFGNEGECQAVVVLREESVAPEVAWVSSCCSVPVSVAGLE